jgi:hypothetical protein
MFVFKKFGIVYNVLYVANHVQLLVFLGPIAATPYDYET